MWIETTGLPGVGKTRLYEQVMGTLPETLRIVRSNHCGIINSLGTRLAKPFIGRECKDPELGRKLAYRLSFRFFLNKNDRIFFYDSGIVQVLLENLIVTGFDNCEIKLKLLEKLGLPERLIWVEDEIETIVFRETNREPRRFSLPPDSLRPHYERAATLLEKQILPRIKQVYRVRSGDIDNFKKALTA